jgi:hypothetical protein
MNWKFLFQMSLIALVMGISTVFVISSSVEQVLWPMIMVVSAYFIARVSSRWRFVHGPLLGLMNSFWVTSCHLIFATRYLANHLKEAEMSKTMPMHLTPWVAMALFGPIIGIVSGLLIGVLATIIGIWVKPDAAAVSSTRDV